MGGEGLLTLGTPNLCEIQNIGIVPCIEGQILDRPGPDGPMGIAAHAEDITCVKATVSCAMESSRTVKRCFAFKLVDC